MRNRKLAALLSDSAIVLIQKILLVNGQHNRLLAVIKTGLTQPFIVIKNLPDKSKLIMDVGKSRVMSDRITVSGIRITRKECSIIRHAMSKVTVTLQVQNNSQDLATIILLLKLI